MSRRLPSPTPISNQPNVNTHTDMSEWYYVADGEQRGPVSREQLVELGRTRRLAEQDLVWREGMAEWIPAHTVPGLLHASGAAAPASTHHSNPVSYLSEDELWGEEYETASAGQRFANLLLDSVFYIIFSFLIGVVFAVAGLGEFIVSVNETLLGFVIIIVYYLSQEAVSGRTIGKLITGTKAVGEDGSDLTFGQAIGRTLCRFIPFEAFSFLGSTTRGWHDSIPKTKVIRLRSKGGF